MRYMLLLMLAVGLGTGCGPASPPAPAPETPPGTPAPATPAQATRVAFVSNNASDFWKIAEAGTRKAAAEFGVDTVFRIPSAGTAEQQQQILQDLVTTGVSGIAISPVDPSNQTEMLNDAAAKVRLITQDSDAPESNRACYIGTNNFDAGIEAGKLVQACTPPGSKLIICVGTVDAQNAHDRLEGLKKQIASTGHVIAEVRTDETDRAKAIANVQDALVKDSGIACFVGLWSYNGPAILNGVKDSGRLGTVKIVCFDEEDETLQGVKDGHIYGTVVQRPFEFGYQSVKLLKELADGNQSSVPPAKQIFIPTLSVTKDNVDAFWAELKSAVGKG
jgi:ribose transport system substrate-binding protein